MLESARHALLLLNRETDPISYGNAADTKVYVLEHGLTIALFSIGTATRLPLESYIGFMMFKNGHPMAYGGAWLFGTRSLIGINIFEAFRGGESAFVFAQLLRTYKQAFCAQQFEVEPYQFGKNNPEGLQSGAFWFYHRFGFRPVDPVLFELAAREHEKIGQQPGYRTAVPVLKEFTKSNLFVDFGSSKTLIKPAVISSYITQVITDKFKGDRQAAFTFSKTMLKKELSINFSLLNDLEKAGFLKLSLFVCFCLDLKKFKARDKQLLVKLIKEKGSDEFKYILTYHQIDFEKYFVKELREAK